jgi:hypothetical protein
MAPPSHPGATIPSPWRHHPQIGPGATPTTIGASRSITPATIGASRSITPATIGASRSATSAIGATIGATA